MVSNIIVKRKSFLAVGAFLLAGLLLLAWQIIGLGGAAATEYQDRPRMGPPVVPGESPMARQQRIEDDLRKAVANIPDNKKIWVDGDIVVYLLRRDPHNLAGEQVAVAHHLPTTAALNYDQNGNKLGASVVLHPDAPRVAAEMETSPAVRAAVMNLLGRIK